MTERVFDARAYRDGTVVCERALITETISDQRLGLAPSEQRHMTVRFLHGIAPAFRAQLIQLLRCRGARSRRIADALDPIELELHDRQRLTARIEPPMDRNHTLEHTDFRLRRHSG